MYLQLSAVCFNGVCLPCVSVVSVSVFTVVCCVSVVSVSVFTVVCCVFQ